MDDGASTEPISPTPKLSLFTFPNLQPKPQDPPGMLTPPLRSTLASVPFQWEEVPGKPRTSSSSSPSSDSKTTARRCLELPPRLLIEQGKITDLSSPTTVLDGPDSGRSLSHTLSFSSLVGRRSSLSFRKEARNCSWRLDGTKGGDGGDRRGSSDFSFGTDGGCDDNVKKLTSGGRKRQSFLGSSKSHLLISMYERVKHALMVVPWRSRKHQQK